MNGRRYSVGKKVHPIKLTSHQSHWQAIRVVRLRGGRRYASGAIKLSITGKCMNQVLMCAHHGLVFSQYAPTYFHSCKLYSDIDRDLVSIALSYFDRYIARRDDINETLYQLAAMTSLYLAVKTHSTRKISVSSMVSINYIDVYQPLHH